MVGVSSDADAVWLVVQRTFFGIRVDNISVCPFVVIEFGWVNATSPAESRVSGSFCRAV